MIKSIANTIVSIDDTFTTSVLNFTAKHTCSYINKITDDMIGRIVIATGKYKNIDNTNRITIDEAIPIVKLSDDNNDSKAFGVISNIEKDTTTREYKIGNIIFKKDKDAKDIKLQVNSAGEGGIWVSNMNGDLKNGDLITTCKLKGYGMKQDDDIVRSYTVAKITCDCDFKKSKTISHNSKTYKIEFVGCIYKF